MDGGVAQNDFIVQYIADLTGEKYVSHDALMLGRIMNLYAIIKINIVERRV